MRSNHSRDSFHWVEPRPHRLLTPLVHEFGRGTGVDVFPKELKFLFEQVGPNGLQIAFEQILEFDALLIGEVFGTFEQTPA